MISSTATIAAFVIIAASSQVLGADLLNFVQDDVQKTVKWIEREGNQLKYSLKKDVEDYRSTLRSNLEDKVARINEYFNQAIEEVERLPFDCRANARTSLETLRQSSLSDFLHCPNLLPGLLDILYIFDLSVELLFDVMITSSDTVKGMFTCLTDFWPWKILSCWKNQVENNFDQLVDESKLFRSLVEEYAHNMTTTLEHCWNNSAVVANLLSTVTPMYECAHVKIPERHYTL